MTPAAAGDPGAGSADLRYRVGMLSLTLSLISPLFALVVPFFGLHTATTAALIGFFLIGGPEIFLVVGVALAGKRALETIKTRLSAVFKRRFPPKAVSRRRYNVGLLLLVLGNALLLGVAYVPYVLGMPVAQNTRLYLDLAGDVMIIVSFFVMGEQFWEKLKGLFNWEPEVSRLPSSHTAT